MGGESEKFIRVGVVSIPLARAQGWVRQYTAEDVKAAKPYAYPAYDRFDAEGNDPTRLTDGDLLAPGMLNVPVKIDTFYDLAAVRGQLEAALANDDLALPLADVDDTVRVEHMVKPLYAVLDDPSRRPRGAKATTLSKVLHRKRPQSVVLHDRWVQECYAGPGRTVPYDKSRSWSDYMVAITLAIQHDVKTQRDAWAALDAVTPRPGELSYIRLLDIVAWTSKGEPMSEAADDTSVGRRGG